MASHIFDYTSCDNLFVAFATVTGFAEVKSGRGLDYVFVVEVFWSDKRTAYVKRTYKDFVKFYRQILNKLKTKSAGCDAGWRHVPKLEGKVQCKGYAFDTIQRTRLLLRGGWGGGGVGGGWG